MSCSQCGVEGGLLLHHVCLHGVFSKVCTNCFVRLHPHAFCPTCYLVYESEFPHSQSLKRRHGYLLQLLLHLPYHLCGSRSHQPLHLPSIYALTLTLLSLSIKDAEGRRKAIDETAARVLLAATKIAAVATNRVAAEAKEKALRKLQKAAFASRKAKEALIHFRAIQEEAEHAEKSGLTDLESDDLSDLESNN